MASNSKSFVDFVDERLTVKNELYLKTKIAQGSKKENVQKEQYLRSALLSGAYGIAVTPGILFLTGVALYQGFRKNPDLNRNSFEKTLDIVCYMGANAMTVFGSLTAVTGILNKDIGSIKQGLEQLTIGLAAYYYIKGDYISRIDTTAQKPMKNRYK